jgi:DNA (cytosine-5)-methyltransferase 1
MPPAPTQPLRTVDLFAGCGGLSLGLAQAGFDVVAAFDHWAPAVAVYRDNFDHPIHDVDLGQLDASGDWSQIAAYAPDVIAGGPPCQDFSSAGKLDEAGGRGDMTPAFARCVAQVRPRIAIMENVERAPKSVRYQMAMQILRDAGYGLTLRVLDAAHAGVPQNRKRAFLIAQLGGADDGFGPALESGLSDQPMTVRQYMGAELALDHFYRHPRNYQRRGVFSVDFPSPTVRGMNRPLPTGYPGHPGDSADAHNGRVRALTTAERARLQTFPASFRFAGSQHAREQMIGNAVPVELAAYVGRQIASTLAAS